MTNLQTIRAFLANPNRDVTNAKGSILARDGILYSYGRHYPLAWFAADGALEVNTRKVSVTTSQHSSRVAGTAAVDGFEVRQVEV
jgi:hypothetical protein